MAEIEIPEFVFFTGAPGSRWSGIAQILELHPSSNTTDRTPHRQYQHSDFSGHLGAYFGPGMEFDAVPDADYLRGAWADPESGFKLVKSHHWAYMLDVIVEKFADAWIMLVWREDSTCDSWWHQAGGFNIVYPNYGWYENSEKMTAEIAGQNRAIEDFVRHRNLIWQPFDAAWVYQNFGFNTGVPSAYGDVRVAVRRA